MSLSIYNDLDEKENGEKKKGKGDYSPSTVEDQG
jgi:hypothetical protein